MQCLLNEQAVEQLPIQASVLVDANQAEVTVTNLSDSPICQGFLLLSEDRLVKFDRIDARDTVVFRRPMVAGCSLRKALHQGREGWDMALTSPSHPPFNATLVFWAQGCDQRTRGIEGYLADGAALLVVLYDEEPADFQVQNRRYEENHIRLVRLVVFPQKGTLL